MKNAQPSQLFGALVILAVLCWFEIVIGYRWLILELPTTGMFPLLIFGLTVVGAVFGFIVASFANIALRLGPPKLRVPLSAIAWLAFVILIAWALLSAGADLQRTLIATAITGVCGLLVGPYHAELLVGLWFLKRLQRRQSSNS